MKRKYVRICPVCDTENPPDQVHCSTCLALLSGVDFSLPRETATTAQQAELLEPAAPVLAPESLAPESVTQQDRLPETPEAAQPETPPQKPEPESRPKPKLKPKPEARPEPEAKLEVKAEPVPELQPEPELKPELKLNEPELKPEPEAKPEAAPEAKVEPEPEPEPVPNPLPESEPVSVAAPTSLPTANPASESASEEVPEPELPKPADGNVTPASVEETVVAPTLRISIDNAASGIRCPSLDCGQYNPPGTVRCLYCNTLLPEAPPTTLTSRPSLRMRMSSSGQPPELELEMPELGQNVPAGSSFKKTAPRPRATLPAELASRFKLVQELRASGSEADLFIVDPLTGGDSRVFKLYRRGIRPDSALLARLSSAGSHVIKIFEYGVFDDLTWELMEYCRVGNLRAIIQKGMLNQELLRQIVQELAAALKEIHAQHILHRDLKPENILVRQLKPLSLVLTDFGISSITEGTRHFTDSARTVRYASPEALTGLIDAKTDWWSMGMILLEAASGRHPFSGLSEHVVNHHLATRPIEIKGIADDDFARLCRGLLLRDPASRWGSDEVERWLKGDPTLIAPHEAGAEMVRPYRIGQHAAKTAEQLALGLAEHWQEGVRDLKRGMILDWVKRELQDFELTRQLSDILEVRGDSDDRRLLRFILVAAPKIPPLWLGQPAHRITLVSRAKQAMKTGKAAEEAKLYLDSLFVNDVLALFVDHGQTDMKPLNEAWRQGLVQVCRIWETVRKEAHKWRHRPREQAANFDNLVYGLRDEIPSFPARKEWNPLFILALMQHGFLVALEQEIRQTAEEVAEDVPWFTHLIAYLLDTPAGETATPPEKIAQVLVAYRLQEPARQVAHIAHQARRKEMVARERVIEDLRQEAMRDLAPLAMQDENKLDDEACEEMRQLLEKFLTTANHILGLSYPEESFTALTQHLYSLQHTAFNLLQALDKLEAKAVTRRIVRLATASERPHGLLGVLTIIAVTIARFFPWLLAALGGFAFWHYLQHRRLRLSLKHQIRIFQRHIKRFASHQLPQHPLSVEDENGGHDEEKKNTEEN